MCVRAFPQEAVSRSWENQVDAMRLWTFQVPEKLNDTAYKINLLFWSVKFTTLSMFVTNLHLLLLMMIDFEANSFQKKENDTIELPQGCSLKAKLGIVKEMQGLK